MKPNIAMACSFLLVCFVGWGRITARSEQEGPATDEIKQLGQKIKRIEKQIDALNEQIDALAEQKQPLVKQIEQLKLRHREAQFPGIRDPDLGYIYGFTLSPDGKVLAIGTDGKGVYLWSTTTRKRLRHLGKDIPAGISTIAFSPDGKTLAAACYYAGISLWDVAAGKHLHTLGDKSTAGRAVAFSPDGKTLASGDYNGGKMRHWEVETGKLLRVWHGHDHHIFTVAFMPDGQSLGSYSPDYVLRQWDSKDGKLLREWKAAWEIGGLSFSRGGQAIAIGRREGTDTLSSWHPTDKQAATWFPGQLMNLSGTNSFTRDGQTFYSSARPDAVSVLEVRTRQERCRFVGHIAPVFSIAGSPDGRLVVSACQKREILLWDVPGHLKKSHPVPNSVEEMWASLGSAEASKAYLAHWLLVDTPAQSVLCLQKRLRRVNAPEKAKVADLVSKLDSDAFAVRERARKELEGLGELVEDSLQKAAGDHPSLEARQRAARILTKIRDVSLSGKLRALRAIEVLEHIGTPEAGRVLAELAQGTPLAWETQEAQLALRRLAK